MTIPLINQIQSAEYGLAVTNPAGDPRFVPATGSRLRAAGARLIRSGANRGLRLADRLDHRYQPA